MYSSNFLSDNIHQWIVPDRNVFLCFLGKYVRFNPLAGMSVVGCEYINGIFLCHGSCRYEPWQESGSRLLFS